MTKLGILKFNFYDVIVARFQEKFSFFLKNILFFFVINTLKIVLKRSQESINILYKIKIFIVLSQEYTAA